MIFTIDLILASFIIGLCIWCWRLHSVVGNLHKETERLAEFLPKEEPLTPMERRIRGRNKPPTPDSIVASHIQISGCCLTRESLDKVFEQDRRRSKILGADLANGPDQSVRTEIA